MAVNSVAWLNKQRSQTYAQNLLNEVKSGNEDVIDSICMGIFDSTAGRLGTNEAFVETILNGADSETLALIMDRYKDVTGSEIYKDIENDFSGKKEDEYLKILKNAYLEVNNKLYTGWNDGELSIQDAARSVSEGILSPVTSMFKSPLNFAIGAATIVGCAALTAATGGAALPFIIGAGIGVGTIQVGSGVYQTATADTDEQAEQGLESIGAGGITIGLSALAGKASTQTVSAPNNFFNIPPSGSVVLADAGYAAAAEAAEVTVSAGAISEGLVLGGKVLFAKKPKGPARNRERVVKDNNRDRYNKTVDHVTYGELDSNGNLSGRHVLEQWKLDENTGQYTTTIDGQTFFATDKNYGIYDIRTESGQFVKIQGLASQAEYDHLLGLLDPNTGTGITTNETGCFIYNGKYWRLFTDLSGCNSVSLYPISKAEAVNLSGGKFPVIT